MENYIGEFDPPADHPYWNYTATDWALAYIMAYGGIDGEHHKAWVLDQVARILNGTPVIFRVARWGTLDEIVLEETRFNTGEPSQQYIDWVAKARDGEDGPDTYGYDEGIAP